MPNIHLAPAELRAILRELTQLSTRNRTVLVAIDKMHEALDAARTRRENRQAEELTAQTLRRNKAIEDRNTELYQSWNDIEPVTDLATAARDTIEALRRANAQPTLEQIEDADVAKQVARKEQK